MTSGLAAIGSAVGGGMFAGIGVLAAGSATSAAIAAAIANKLIPDPALKELAESLGKANELYAAAKICTEAQQLEMEGLNVRIGHLLDAKKSDAAELEHLKARLTLLIHDLERDSLAAGTKAMVAEDGSEVETKPVGDPAE
jgi:tRNA G37 N-methylase Trm5